MKVHVARVVEFIWGLRINDAVPSKNVDLLGVLSSCKDGAKYWLRLVARQIIYTFVFVLRSKSASPKIGSNL